MNKVENYVPVMRLKKGELAAIKELSKEALDRFTPLFDIPKIPIKDGKKTMTLDQHINKIFANLEKVWPKHKLFLFDFSFLELDQRTQDGTHPIKYICEILKKKNMFFSPTIGTDVDFAYLDAIKEFILNFPYGLISLRLLNDDFNEPPRGKPRGIR
jgi:hypothetical protein